MTESNIVSLECRRTAARRYGTAVSSDELHHEATHDLQTEDELGCVTMSNDT